MKSVWIFTLAFGICISLCDGSCFQSEPELEIDSNGNPVTPTACVEQDGTRHDLDTTWVSNCMDCSCGTDGSVSCCTNFATPVGYDEDNCEAFFDENSCSYTVVKKDDPKETCEVTAYVG
ncbi:beta-microseminoprotein A1 [Microcaecilia unicolor]|uniref:Beta-microseminoprotein A1-like n=1 Tax=Microcaecilia unicolor TaxID=1415580 RepID=A0A6P7YD55_9AMPH|nr:beta-microseminoprotein A1-like [Microcaecilia unicolor]